MEGDATNLYWTDGSTTIFALPKSGGVVTTLAQSQAQPLTVVSDGTYVYWGNHLGGAIMRTRSDGSGSPQVFVTASQPVGVNIVGPNLYWSETGGDIWQIATSGGTPSLLAATGYGPLVGKLETDGVALYASGKPVSYAEVRVALSTGALKGLGAFQALPLVINGTSAFFPDFGGNVLSVEDKTTAVRIEDYQASIPVSVYAANACGVFWSGGLLYQGAPYSAPLLYSVSSQQQFTVFAIDGSYMYVAGTTSGIDRIPLP